MAEYPYPYHEPEPGLWVLALHLLLFCVSLVPFAGLFIQSRRPATNADACLWIFGILLAPLPFGLGILLSAEHSRPFLVGLLILTEVVCLLALAITCVRLWRQGKAINAMIVVGGLLGTVLFVCLLLPSVPSAREAARRMQCSNNLKQLAFGVLSYHEEWDHLPAATTASREGILTSWRVDLAPYLEFGHLAAKYDRTREWDSTRNQPIAQTRVPALMCPSNIAVSDDLGRYLTAYAFAVSAESPFSTNPRRMPEAASSTLGIVEACGRNLVWTQPEDVDVSTLPLGVNLPGKARQSSHGIVSSMHPGGANVSMLDGSVRFLSEDTDQQTIRQLLAGAKHP